MSEYERGRDRGGLHSRGKLADVEEASTELKRLFVEGRLSVGEYEQQLEALYSGRTVRVRSPMEPAAARQPRAQQTMWPLYALAILLVIAIGSFAVGHFFWPLWPMFWVIFLATRAFGNGVFYNRRGWR